MKNGRTLAFLLAVATSIVFELVTVTARAVASDHGAAGVVTRHHDSGH